MFTGIITQTGIIKSLLPKAGGRSLSVDIGSLAQTAQIGDSIAINGSCLTISSLSGSLAYFDLSPETLKKTTLAKLKHGGKVNLEPAMTPQTQFGGHFVLGHIDGIAIVSSIQQKGDFAEIAFKCSAEMLDEMVVKGSVAVDGVSLTIARMDIASFTVAVIPTTLKFTTLASAKSGDEVNIETDIIVKTIKKQLQKIMSDKSGLTVEELRNMGF